MTTGRYWQCDEELGEGEGRIGSNKSKQQVRIISERRQFNLAAYFVAELAYSTNGIAAIRTMRGPCITVRREGEEWGDKWERGGRRGREGEGGGGGCNEAKQPPKHNQASGDEAAGGRGKRMGR